MLIIFYLFILKVLYLIFSVGSMCVAVLVGAGNRCSGDYNRPHHPYHIICKYIYNLIVPLRDKMTMRV